MKQEEIEEQDGKEKSEKKLSGMFRQYNAIKEQYSDSVLFFRLGDFYELFDKDAVEISKVLGLTLTGKSGGVGKIPMCGIPYHSVEQYINKLINMGYKIAICEQTQQAGAGIKLVNRDVVRVITPGTAIDDGVVDRNKNNYIASIYQSDSAVGVAYCDLSTGEFAISEFDAKNYISGLNDILVRILPSEILSCAEANLKDILPCVKSGWMPEFIKYDPYKFSKSFSGEVMEKYFGVTYQTVYDLKDKAGACMAGGALIAYLEETQKRVLGHINRIKVLLDGDYLHLDVNTRRNLEILETLKDRRKKGALLNVIDKTKTPMGARLLRNWIQQPLCDEKQINDRLDAVDELLHRLIDRDSIKSYLNQISDIERITGKIAYGSFTPKDAVSLRSSLQFIPKIKQILGKFSCEKLSSYSKSLPDYESMVELLNRAFDDESSALISNGNFIRRGFSKELDEIRDRKSNIREYISKLEAKEREITHIESLRITYNKVIGYFIEIDKNLMSEVPMRYTRKQTVADKDRYITEELRNYQESLNSAEDDALNLEKLIFGQIRELLFKKCKELQSTSVIIAEIDCLLSLAEIAASNGYCRPKISSKIKHILIEGGRHPVVEDINKNNNIFIPNDTYLDCKENKMMIITGPNMAGKSTYMRQVAVITLLAHIGSFVPATKAEISITDRIFTRVGASDDLAVGQSTFMVEMMEVANILQTATKNSLVILDEIGRGTSTFDGLSIAWAVVEEIAQNMSCKTMFATHYHELTELEGLIDGVKNYKIAIKEKEGELVFLRKIQRGGANRSYGIEVAKLAGVPNNVIKRAKEISYKLEQNNLCEDIVKETSDEQNINENRSYPEVIGILKDLDINKISPLEAFEMLCDLSQKVKN